MKQNGFTLAELLVALFIFGILSAGSVGLLAFGVEARARSGERLAAQGALLRSRALLGADLAQAAPRRWRDEAGQPQAAFSGSGAALRLVRRGWANDGGAPRASLQRVEYQLRDGRLERQAWPMLDGAAPGPAAVLLQGVRAMRLRFYGREGWQESWQPLTADALPQAVEMQLLLAGEGEVRQLFLVGPGTAVMPGAPA